MKRSTLYYSSIAAVIIALIALLLAVQYGLFNHSKTTELATSDTAAQAQPINDYPNTRRLTDTHPTQSAASKATLMGHPLSIAGNGNLLPSPSVRELFDSIARQKGETPVDQWKQQILSQFKDQLPAPALNQLQTLLNHYVEYNLALQLMPMEGAASLKAAMNQVQSLREEYLGDAESSALFADWQQLESFTHDYVEQLAHTQYPETLRPSLQAQVDSLPITVRARAQKVLDASADLFQPRQASVEPATLQSIAEQIAAVALIQPNFMFAEPSADFMDRYSHYAQEKNQLLQSGSADSENDTALNALRQRYFSGSDLLRVKTLDRAEMF
jgi:lipase chaperone LimK